MQNKTQEAKLGFSISAADTREFTSHDVIVGDNGFVGDHDIVGEQIKCAIMTIVGHWSLINKTFFKLYRYFVEWLDMDAETDLCR